MALGRADAHVCVCGKALRVWPVLYEKVLQNKSGTFKRLFKPSWPCCAAVKTCLIFSLEDTAKPRGDNVSSKGSCSGGNSGLDWLRASVNVACSESAASLCSLTPVLPAGFTRGLSDHAAVYFSVFKLVLFFVFLSEVVLRN